LKKQLEADPTLEIVDLSVFQDEESKQAKEKAKAKTKTNEKETKEKTDKKKGKSKKIKLTPYREIELSDGKGLYIKTTCNLTSDQRVQVIQYRESPDPEGTKFACTEPSYFESKDEFLEWISQLIRHNFDDLPFIKIVPLKEEELIKKERETTDTMYL
jgi:hypothetical protein